jgi:hypothetical protein
LVLLTLAGRRDYYLEDLQRIERGACERGAGHRRTEEASQEWARSKFVFINGSFDLNGNRGKPVAEGLSERDPRIQIVPAGETVTVLEVVIGC